MTNKLTIEHLSSYLPYRLQIDFLSTKYTVSGIVKDIMYTEEGPVLCYHKRELPQVIFPCMRPLSQLTQEITHEGKTFVPIVELAKIGMPEYDFGIIQNHTVNGNDHYTVQSFEGYVFGFMDNTFYIKSGIHDAYTARNQTELFRLLYSWHFDITGDLLSSGLAIEKPAK